MDPFINFIFTNRVNNNDTYNDTFMYVFSNSTHPYVTQKLNKRILITKLNIPKYYKCKKTHECIICLENVKKKEFTRQLYCGHDFHKKCIDHWLYTLYYEDKLINCPLCRKLVCFKDINGVV